MAGKKKKIDAFQKAMLSNTKFIGKEEDDFIADFKREEEPTLKIDKNIFMQFKILADYQSTEPKQLIEEALLHYLRLKSIKLEKAMKELTRDND